MPSIDSTKTEATKHTPTPAEAIRIVTGYPDNEATAYPFWAIVSNGAFGRLVFEAGVWFSRESANDHLSQTRYNYPKSARVFCFSGHKSSDFRRLVDASRAALALATKEAE